MQLTSGVAVSSVLAGIAAVVIIVAGVGAFYLLNAAPRSSNGSTTLSSTTSSSSFNITVSTHTSRISSSVARTSPTLGTLTLSEWSGTYTATGSGTASDGSSSSYTDSGKFSFDTSTGKGSGSGHITMESTYACGSKWHGSTDYTFTIDAGVDQYSKNVTFQLSPPTSSPNPQVVTGQYTYLCPNEQTFPPQAGFTNLGAQFSHGS